MDVVTTILEFIITSVVLIGYLPLCVYVGYRVWKLGATKQRAIAVGVLSIVLTPLWAVLYLLLRGGYRRYVPSKGRETMSKLAYTAWHYRSIRYTLMTCLAIAAVSFMMMQNQDKIRQEFVANRVEIIQKAEEALQNKHYQHVIDVAEPYAFIEDEELSSLYETALLGAIDSIAGDRLTDLESKKDLFRQLSNLKDEYDPQ